MTSAAGLINTWSYKMNFPDEQLILEAKMDCYAHFARDKDHNFLPHCIQLSYNGESFVFTAYVFENELGMLTYVHEIGRDRFIDLVIN